MAEHQAGGSTAKIARLKQRGGFLGKLASEFQAGQKDVDQTAQSAQKFAKKAAAQAKAIKAKVRAEQEKRRKNAAAAAAAKGSKEKLDPNAIDDSGDCSSSDAKDVNQGDGVVSGKEEEGGDGSSDPKKKVADDDYDDEDAGAFWARMEEQEGGSGAAPIQKATSLAVRVSVCVCYFTFPSRSSISFGPGVSTARTACVYLCFTTLSLCTPTLNDIFFSCILYHTPGSAGRGQSSFSRCRGGCRCCHRFPGRWVLLFRGGSINNSSSSCSTKQQGQQQQGGSFKTRST